MNHSRGEQEGPGTLGYLALALAWVAPGLGHLLLGERARAAIFFVAIHGLFAAGMLIGGIRAINPPDQPIWTYTQFLTGWPMLVANTIERHSRQDLAKLQRIYVNGNEEFAGRPNLPDEREKYGKAFLEKHPVFAYHPKVQDIGAVYCGIAGMLNLLVWFDVMLRVTGSVREEPGKRKRAAASADAQAATRAGETGSTPISAAGAAGEGAR